MSHCRRCGLSATGMHLCCPGLGYKREENQVDVDVDRRKLLTPCWSTGLSSSILGIWSASGGPILCMEYCDLSVGRALSKARTMYTSLLQVCLKLGVDNCDSLLQSARLLPDLRLLRCAPGYRSPNGHNSGRLCADLPRTAS